MHTDLSIHPIRPSGDTKILPEDNTEYKKEELSPKYKIYGTGAVSAVLSNKCMHMISHTLERLNSCGAVMSVTLC